jgi:hypothetical protein
VIHRDVTGLRTGSALETFNGTTWLPLTVNRYADLAALTAETSRDRGTLGWIDSLAELCVYDGSAWRIVNLT